MKKEDNPELYHKALDWYTKTEPGYKKAALDLFSEDELKAGVDEYKVQKKKELAKERQEFLQKTLERSKKIFPIGTLVWSHESSDRCANIIISEPYLGKGYPLVTHFHYGLEDEGITVFADSLRVGYFKNELITPVRKDKVCLENCLYYMDKDKNNQFYRNHIIDLKEYHKKKAKDKSDEIARLDKNIKQYEEQLKRQKEELAVVEAFDPNGLTEEKIKQLIKEFENRKDGNR